MKELISTIEPRQFVDANTDITVSGYRVAQVAEDDMTFGVNESFFWTDCSSDVIADQFIYDKDAKQIVKINQKIIAFNKSNMNTNSSGAQTF